MATFSSHQICTHTNSQARFQENPVSVFGYTVLYSCCCLVSSHHSTQPALTHTNTHHFTTNAASSSIRYTSNKADGTKAIAIAHHNQGFVYRYTMRVNINSLKPRGTVNCAIRTHRTWHQKRIMNNCFRNCPHLKN